MPPIRKSVKDLPPGLKVYAFHGVLFAHPEGADEATADCPFCDSTKFSVHAETSKGRCWACKWTGNSTTFLRRLHSDSLASTKESQYVQLAADRGLLSGDTPRRWGVAVSALQPGTWLLPGYNTAGQLVQLYRYVRPTPSDKPVMLASPGLSHGLHLAPPLPKGGEVAVDLCEGPWDGMAMEECLRAVKSAADGRLVPTTNPEASLLAGRLVAAVPGCGVFQPSWGEITEGRPVTLWYDSDHPKEKGQQPGLDGCKMVTRTLSACEHVPGVVSYLRWGPDGYDPTLPSGYDVRDALKEETTAPGRAAVVLSLREKVEACPSSWVGQTGGKKGGVKVEPLECTRWKDLETAWKKALKWTPGLRGALVCMLSSAASTGFTGDQLWFKIVGPPSCGKSTLCEGLAVAKDRVHSVSTLRGFHSGFQSDKGASEDVSLVSKINGKTLVLKDGDTLLQQPNLGQILAEARDVYDRVSRTSYRNKASREYEGVSMTWLLCGTSSLRALDDSELGQRFLDWVIMEGIDEDIEKEVNGRKLASLRSMLYSGADASRDGDTPEILKAKRLTGGYVQHLRRVAQDRRAELTEPDDAFLEYVSSLARFVAVVRARPSKKQDEEVSREMSTRLASQLFVLATAACIVMDLPGPDCEAVRDLLRRCAVYTARGRTMAIIRQLAVTGREGLEVRAVATLTGELPQDTRKLMLFLRKIRAVEAFQPTVGGKPRGGVRYRLTQPVADSYRVATEGDATGTDS